MEEPQEESESEVDIKLNVSPISPTKHLQQNHKLKNLVIKLQRIDSPKVPSTSNLCHQQSWTSGKCVICSELFFVPEASTKTNKKKEKGPRSRTKADINVDDKNSPPRLASKDFHFLLSKCLEASEGQCRRMRSKDGFTSSFCPKHAAILVEARQIQEELESLEKLLQNLRKQIRDAVVESFVLEENSWSSSPSMKTREYTNLRAILRDVSSKYVEELEVESPQKNPRITSTTPILASPFIFNGDNTALLTDVKVEPPSPAHVDDVDHFDDICDLPILDVQDLLHSQSHLQPEAYSSNFEELSSCLPTLIPETAISSLAEDTPIPLETKIPLESKVVPDFSKIGFGDPFSPYTDPDYCPTDEEEISEDLEVNNDDDEDYIPESKPSSPSKRSPKRKIKSEPTDGDPIKPKRIRKYVSKRIKKETNGILQSKRRRRGLVPRPRPNPKNREILTYCKYCDTNFDSLDILKSHQEAEHGGEKPYTCKICPRRYAKKMMLEGHRRRDHEGILTVACDICNKMFATQSLMKDHRRNHFYDITPLPCPLACSPKLYKGPRRVALHMKYAHSETPPKRYHQPDLVCSECGKTYRNFGALDYHRQKVHLKTNPKVVCDVCGKELSDVRSLKKHKNSQHFKNFKFLCELCPTRCLFKSHLDAHMKASHGQQGASGETEDAEAAKTSKRSSRKKKKKKKRRRRRESYDKESGTEDEEEDFGEVQEEDSLQVPLNPTPVIDKVEASDLP